ncbi:MAG TPA: TetR/AcrR family transcriptional regulator [Thermoanaerobaculia bacterium]|nr:TetR/AcrR family transcriptional regulator [Thermoanaerobaculia bacterium]
MRALPGKASRQPPGPEPVSRAAASDDQRRRILEATADLVAEHGYAETTIEQVVRRARVGYATFYKHYSDKDEAFLALLDAAVERTLYEVEEAYDREDGPWPDKVGAGLGALLKLAAAHPGVARACLVEAPTAGPEAAARHEAALKRFVPMLEPGRELNPRSEMLPKNLEETLLGGVLWVINQRLIAGEADQLRALLPEALEFLLRPYVGEDVAAREAGGAGAASA